MAYKLAVVGYGGMGEWHHENIKSKIPEIEVVGAYDVRAERLEKAAANGIRPYGSLEEILNDKSVDIVTVAATNNFHRDISIACLEAGKNVVCEKPVAMNAAELEEIIKVSQETGKLFSVHQNRRWDQDYVTIKKIVDENILGEPYWIENRVDGSRRVLHGWRGYKIDGGGMVLDWGVHLIDQLMDLIKSPVTDVSAHLAYVYSREVDDNCKIMLTFANGVHATVEVATNCFITHPRWHLSCKDGTAAIYGWECEGKMVKLSDDEQLEWEESIVYTKAGPTRTMAPRPEKTTEQLPLPQVESDWSDYYKNIVAVLGGKAGLIVTPAQALRVMKVIDLVFESSEKGRSIKCEI